MTELNDARKRRKTVSPPVQAHGAGPVYQERAMTTAATPPGWADEAEPGWSPARIAPYGPGYSRCIPGMGMLLVCFENGQYRWWLQTGPAEAMPGQDGFARGRAAMLAADRLTGGPAPGMSAALQHRPKGPGA